jgi:hypothetical protein
MRKHRFSLAALLLAPLILSPLFLACRDSLMMVTQQRHVFGIEILGLGFSYALALTFISYRRQKTAGTFSKSKPFFWSLIRGGLFGVLFFSLFWLPVWITEQIVVYTAPRPWTSRLQFFVLGFAVMAFIGLVFGGAAGGILGLYLSGRHAKPDNSPLDQNSQD